VQTFTKLKRIADMEKILKNKNRNNGKNQVFKKEHIRTYSILIDIYDYYFIKTS